MNFDELRQGLSTFLDSVSDGWQHLRHSASSAFTWFKAGERTNMPAAADIDDGFYLPSSSWSMLGGDVFEDDTRVVVRLEVPGLDKQDLDIQVENGRLVVAGEKRFEREQTQGRYRILQCAYGSFRRSVPLPVEVQAERATASYRNGVLRVELPKAESARPRKVDIRVD